MDNYEGLTEPLYVKNVWAGVKNLKECFNLCSFYIVLHSLTSGEKCWDTDYSYKDFAQINNFKKFSFK